MINFFHFLKCRFYNLIESGIYNSLRQIHSSRSFINRSINYETQLKNEIELLKIKHISSAFYLSILLLLTSFISFFIEKLVYKFLSKQ